MLSTSPTDILNRLGREKLLVIVAHQDDETIIAGVAMQQVCRSGGTAQIVYTTDGGGAEPFDPLRRAKVVQRRRHEALSALALAGVTESCVRFLQYESGPTFSSRESAVSLCHELKDIIINFQPDRIVIGAFEGGHFEHDLTNFLVAQAANCVGFPSSRIWEAPQYNRFYLREPLYRRAHRICPFAFSWAPRFLPGGHSGAILPTSAQELDVKRRMLRCFESQRHVGLIDRFGFPDRFRPLPAHNYTGGPFDPCTSYRFRLNRLLNGPRAFPYAQQTIGTDEYQASFQPIAIA